MYPWSHQFRPRIGVTFTLTSQIPHQLSRLLSPSNPSFTSVPALLIRTCHQFARRRACYINLPKLVKSLLEQILNARLGGDVGRNFQNIHFGIDFLDILFDLIERPFTSGSKDQSFNASVRECMCYCLRLVSCSVIGVRNLSDALGRSRKKDDFTSGRTAEFPLGVNGRVNIVISFLHDIKRHLGAN